MPTLPDGIEYAERGSGPALLLLPGSFGTGAGWKAVITALGADWRVVTTSLIGYGQSAECRPPGNDTMRQQTEAIDAILARIGEPAHIVGHSFGGLAALAHAIDGRTPPLSLTLIEANPLDLLRVAGEHEYYAAFGAMTAVYFAEFEAGRPDAARRVIDFYGGDGTFDAFPARVRDYIVATTASNIRDWSSGTAFAPTPEDYRAIDVPTLIVRGGRGHAAMRRVAELLAGLLPAAALVTIDDGSHFLPMTHPAEIARLIAGHVEQGRRAP